MKTFTLIYAVLLLSSFGLFAQSGLNIRSGGAVTINGNLTITPAPSFVCGNPLIDSRDGKSYSTVLIGSQCWMAQNLNVGTKILGSADQANNGIIEKYCYNDDENMCNVYGGLYQWDEAMQYSTIEGVQGICPSGWHLPSDAEWTTLTTFLGGQALAGGKLKEAGYTHWVSPNTGASNSSGFTTLPGGYRSPYGYFGSLNSYAYLWSSSQFDPTLSWSRFFGYDYEFVAHNYIDKPNGFSSRCVLN